MDGKWVLSSISLPDTSVNLSALAPPGDQIFGEACYTILNNDRKQETFNLPLKTLQDDGWVVDGVSLMKAALKWTDKRFQEVMWKNYN